MNRFITEHELLIITSIAITSFIIRFLPRLFCLNAIVSDTYFHLYRAKTIRDAGFRLTRTMPGVILPHENTYPFLYHYLLALFPERARLWAERLTGAFFDTVNLLIIYFFSSWIINNNYSIGSYDGLPVIAAALYAFSPALLRLGSGPRVYDGSPRVMGQTLYLAHIVSAILFLETRDVWSAVISVLAGGLLIVTAKFSVQVLIFFGIFIGFVAPLYFSLIVFSFLASIILTAGKSLLVLKGHIKHSIYYVKNLQRIYLHPHRRALSGYVVNSLRALWHLVTFKPKQALTWFFSENFILHLLIFANTTFIIFFFGISKILLSSKTLLIGWCIAGIFCFFLTKWKPLMFFGEGERYFEYAIYPSLFFSGVVLINNSIIFFIWMLYCLIAYIFYLTYYLKSYSRGITSHSDCVNIFKYLESRESGVLWPLASCWREASYFSKMPVLYFGVNLDEDLLPPHEFELLYGNIPFPSGNWEYILSKYNVSYICGDRYTIELYLKKYAQNSQEFLQRVDQIFISGSLIVYSVRK